jgi:hypothetical protein
MDVEKKFDSYAEMAEFVRQLVREGARHKVAGNYSDGWSVTFETVEQSFEETVGPAIDENQETRDCLIDWKKIISSPNATQEDCDEGISSIQTSLLKVTDQRVRAEALRIIRELELKRPQLPTREQDDERKDLKTREREVEKQPPHCSKCKIPFLLKIPAPGSYFWGCKNYSLPRKDQCHQRKSLTNAEWAMLGLPKT